MSICSLVVYARPEATEEVRSAIEKGYEVCEVVAAESGRLVVVIDTHDRQQMSDTIMALNDIEGVITVSLVFEYFEEGDRIGKRPAQLAQEEMPVSACEAG